MAYKSRKVWLSTPYGIWTVLFTVIPLFLIVLYSFSKGDAFGGIVYDFTGENYKNFLEPIYLNVFWRSISLAFQSTLICFLIGYPMAYVISKSNIKRRNLMVVLFILPLWTNFLLRTYAWMVILREQGILNELLMSLGFIDTPIKFLYTNGAVLMGMVYNFLPFMVLPIYSVLSKIDNSLIEAAEDLGATTGSVFAKVIFPLSLPGVVSGVIMVFMPAVSTFVISDLLGGGQTILLGNLIQNQFMMARNWQFGSAISMIMMAVIVITMGILSKHRSKEGGELW